MNACAAAKYGMDSVYLFHQHEKHCHCLSGAALRSLDG